MLQEENIEVGQFCSLVRELLCSIREINRRLDELDYIVRSNFCTENGIKEICKRKERLKETRDCFIQSLKKTVNNPSEESYCSATKRELSLMFGEVDFEKLRLM